MHVRRRRCAAAVLVGGAVALVPPLSADASGPGNLGGSHSVPHASAVPWGVAIADLNGDSRPDLIVTANSGNTVNVLLGQAAGGFAAPRKFPTPYNPRSVVVRDVNGDGRLDVVVADTMTNTATGAVSVFPGSGNAALLGPRADYATGANPDGLAVADLNRDGRPDLVTANSGPAANSISVLYGRPGGFGPHQDHPAGAMPSAVAVGDLNGDGRPDLVAANFADSTVSVFLQNPVLGYAAAKTYPVGAEPTGVQVADVNGDSRVDVITSDFSGQSASVLLNAGAGALAAQHAYPAGTQARALAVADLNADHRPDLVLTGQNPSVVSVLHGRTDGTFAAAETYPTGATPLALAVGDLNGDGHPDVVTTSYDDGSADVLANTGPGTAPQSRPSTTAPPPASSRPAASPSSVVARTSPVAVGAVPTLSRPSRAPTHPPGRTRAPAAAPSTPRTGAVTSAVAAPPPVQGGPPTPAGNAAAKPSAFARREAAHDFASSVSSPSSLSARQVLHISLLALLALALLALPIALVNDTALLNAAELALLARRLRRRLRLDELGRRTERLPLAAGLLATSVTGGLLYALLVPSVGWDRSTLALVLGLSVGLLLIATTATLTQRAVLNRFAEASRLQLYPGFALLAAACVLVSRLAGLRPGLLLGTLLSLAAVRQLRAEVDGRAKATALAALALLTATGWAVRGHLVVAAGHAGAFAADVVAVIVSSVVIGGAQTLAFEVLPLAFFDGLVIYRWSKAAWAALATFGAAAFVEVLLRPRASTASLVNRTEYLLILLGSYLVIALGFWGWFRYRPDRFRPLIVEDELADAAGRPSPGAR